MANETVTLDIRPLPAKDKHPTIFHTFDGMAPGHCLLLINDHDPKPLYYQFAAERAGEFQWEYAEQGPEIWKVKIQKQKTPPLHDPEPHEHHHFQKATEVLKHEHRIIEKVLASLERLNDPSRDISMERWCKAVEFIRGFADQCHHHKEERLLFPALERQGIPLEGGPIGVMLAEHEEGRGYVRAMAEALANAETDPKGARKALSRSAGSYLRLLREHIQKEEEVLFEIVDSTLSPDEHQQLVREFEEHEEKEVGAGQHDKYLEIAGELER